MLAVFAAMCIPEFGMADDWPNWAGPDHTGISREIGFADEWPADGLTPLWTKEIGIGFSSFSVQGDRLCCMGHVDGQEYVWCLNAITGEVLWKHSYACELIDNLHEGGPCSTPTIADDHVFALGKEGQMFCLQLSDGSVIWQKNLQEDLGVKLPEWGFSSSPRIWKQQVILEAGRVASLDRATGRINWQTDVHEAGYGSVAVFPHQNQMLLATLDCDGLRVINADDGTEIVFHPWKSPYRTNSTTPIVAGDQIFISTGYNIGCGLFQLADGQLNPIYSSKEMRNHFNNSILHQRFLYGFDGNSHNSRVVTLRCMDFQTGEVSWTQRNLGCGSLLIVDEKLLILSEAGELVLARATPDAFQELARSPFLEGRCWTVPVVAHGRVYGRNAAGKVVCALLPRKS